MTLLQSLQRIAFDWGVRAFGIDHMTNRRIRGLRMAEEAVELAQALGVEKEKLHLLVDKVYERDPGLISQEIGGCMVTLSVLCEIMAFDLEKSFDIEIRRVLAKSPEHFTKRNKDKIEMGLS